MSVLFLAGWCLALPVFVLDLFRDGWLRWPAVVGSCAMLLAILPLLLGSMHHRTALVADLDERERRERDVAHLYAYKLLFAAVGLIWVVVGTVDVLNVPLPDSNPDMQQFLFFLVLLLAALPRIVLIWAAPIDDTAEG